MSSLSLVFEKSIDPSTGRVIWINHTAESVSWDPPTHLLPLNYEKQYDANTERYFYIDHQKKITSWEHPLLTLYKDQNNVKDIILYDVESHQAWPKAPKLDSAVENRIQNDKGEINLKKSHEPSGKSILPLAPTAIDMDDLENGTRKMDGELKNENSDVSSSSEHQERRRSSTLASMMKLPYLSSAFKEQEENQNNGISKIGFKFPERNIVPINSASNEVRKLASRKREDHGGEKEFDPESMCALEEDDVEPYIVPDNARSFCFICNEKFILPRRRRHHCRCCGEVVCDKCSPDKHILEPYRKHPTKIDYYKEEERVCTECTRHLACNDFFCVTRQIAVIRGFFEINRKHASSYSQVYVALQTFYKTILHFTDIQQNNNGRDYQTNRKYDFIDSLDKLGGPLAGLQTFLHFIQSNQLDEVRKLAFLCIDSLLYYIFNPNSKVSRVIKDEYIRELCDPHYNSSVNVSQTDFMSLEDIYEQSDGRNSNSNGTDERDSEFNDRGSRNNIPSRRSSLSGETAHQEKLYKEYQGYLECCLQALDRISLQESAVKIIYWAALRYADVYGNTNQERDGAKQLKTLETLSVTAAPKILDLLTSPTFNIQIYATASVQPLVALDKSREKLLSNRLVDNGGIFCLATLLPSPDPNLKVYTLIALVEILKQCNDPTASYIYNMGNNFSAYESHQHTSRGSKMSTRGRSNENIVTPNPNYRVGVYPSTSLSLITNSTKSVDKDQIEHVSLLSSLTDSSNYFTSTLNPKNSGGDKELTLKVLNALTSAGACTAIIESLQYHELVHDVESPVVLSVIMHTLLLLSRLSNYEKMLHLLIRENLIRFLIRVLSDDESLIFGDEENPDQTKKREILLASSLSPAAIQAWLLTLGNVVQGLKDLHECLHGNGNVKIRSSNSFNPSDLDQDELQYLYTFVKNELESNSVLAIAIHYLDHKDVGIREEAARILCIYTQLHEKKYIEQIVTSNAHLSLIHQLELNDMQIESQVFLVPRYYNALVAIVEILASKIPHGDAILLIMDLLFNDSAQFSKLLCSSQRNIHVLEMTLRLYHTLATYHLKFDDETDASKMNSNQEKSKDDLNWNLRGVFINYLHLDKIDQGKSVIDRVLEVILRPEQHKKVFFSGLLFLSSLLNANIDVQPSSSLAFVKNKFSDSLHSLNKKENSLIKQNDLHKLLYVNSFNEMNISSNEEEQEPQVRKVYVSINRVYDLIMTRQVIEKCYTLMADMTAPHMSLASSVLVYSILKYYRQAHSFDTPPKERLTEKIIMQLLEPIAKCLSSPYKDLYELNLSILEEIADYFNTDHFKENRWDRAKSNMLFCIQSISSNLHPSEIVAGFNEDQILPGHTKEYQYKILNISLTSLNVIEILCENRVCLEGIGSSFVQPALDILLNEQIMQALLRGTIRDLKSPMTTGENNEESLRILDIEETGKVSDRDPSKIEDIYEIVLKILAVLSVLSTEKKYAEVMVESGILLTLLNNCIKEARLHYVYKHANITFFSVQILQNLLSNEKCLTTVFNGYTDTLLPMLIGLYYDIKTDNVCLFDIENEADGLNVKDEERREEKEKESLMVLNCIDVIISSVSSRSNMSSLSCFNFGMMSSNTVVENHKSLSKMLYFIADSLHEYAPIIIEQKKWNQSSPTLAANQTIIFSKEEWNKNMDLIYRLLVFTDKDTKVALWHYLIENRYYLILFLLLSQKSNPDSGLRKSISPTQERQIQKTVCEHLVTFLTSAIVELQDIDNLIQDLVYNGLVEELVDLLSDIDSAAFLLATLADYDFERSGHIFVLDRVVKSDRFFINSIDLVSNSSSHPTHNFHDVKNGISSATNPTLNFPDDLPTNEVHDKEKETIESNKVSYCSKLPSYLLDDAVNYQDVHLTHVYACLCLLNKRTNETERNYVSELYNILKKNNLLVKYLNALILSLQMEDDIDAKHFESMENYDKMSILLTLVFPLPQNFFASQSLTEFFTAQDNITLIDGIDSRTSDLLCRGIGGTLLKYFYSIYLPSKLNVKSKRNDVLLKNFLYVVYRLSSDERYASLLIGRGILDCLCQILPLKNIEGLFVEESDEIKIELKVVFEILLNFLTTLSEFPLKLLEGDSNLSISKLLQGLQSIQLQREEEPLKFSLGVFEYFEFCTFHFLLKFVKVSESAFDEGVLKLLKNEESLLIVLIQGINYYLALTKENVESGPHKNENQMQQEIDRNQIVSYTIEKLPKKFSIYYYGLRCIINILNILSTKAAYRSSLLAKLNFSAGSEAMKDSTIPSLWSKCPSLLLSPQPLTSSERKTFALSISGSLENSMMANESILEEDPSGMDEKRDFVEERVTSSSPLVAILFVVLKSTREDDTEMLCSLIHLLHNLFISLVDGVSSNSDIIDDNSEEPEVDFREVTAILLTLIDKVSKFTLIPSSQYDGTKTSVESNERRNLYYHIFSFMENLLVEEKVIETLRTNEALQILKNALVVVQMLKYPEAEKHLFRSLHKEMNVLQPESEERTSLSGHVEEKVNLSIDSDLGDFTVEEVKENNANKAVDDNTNEKLNLPPKYSAKVLRERDRCSVFGISHTEPNISPNSPLRNKDNKDDTISLEKGAVNESTDLPPRTRSLGDITGSKRDATVIDNNLNSKRETSQCHKTMFGMEFVDEATLTSKLSFYFEGLETNVDHTTLSILKILNLVIYTSKATKHILLSDDFQFMECLTLVLVNYTLLSPLIANPQLGIFSNMENSIGKLDSSEVLVSENVHNENDFPPYADIYDYIYPEKYLLSKPLIVQVSLLCLEIMQNLCVLRIGKSRFNALLQKDCPFKINVKSLGLMIKRTILQRALNVLALSPNEIVRRAYSNFKRYMNEESAMFLSNELNRARASEELITILEKNKNPRPLHPSKLRPTSIGTSEDVSFKTISLKQEPLEKKTKSDPKKQDGMVKSEFLKEIVGTSTSLASGRRTRTTDKKKNNKQERNTPFLKRATEDEELKVSTKENVSSNRTPNIDKSLPPLYNSLLKGKGEEQSNEMKKAMLEYYGKQTFKDSENSQSQNSPPQYHVLQSTNVSDSSSSTGTFKNGDKRVDSIVEIEPIEPDNDNNTFAVPCINGCLIPLPDGMDEYNRIRCRRCKGKLQISM